MTLKRQLTTLLKDIVNDLGIEAVASVDYPLSSEHGDYATNIALVAAKKLGKNPMELAEKIVSDLRSKSNDLRLIEKIEIAHPGFINFWIKNDSLLQEVLQNEMPQIGKGKKVIVEYSSPNIAKPFTIGHLRSTIIGDAVANLLEAVGYDVFRDNHIGDWGTQFGKQIAALKFIDYQTKNIIEEVGSYLENLRKNIDLIGHSDRPVKLLVEFYVLFHELEERHIALEDLARAEFIELEQSKEWQEEQEYSNRWIWKKCIEWSWKEFDEIYKQLGVSFKENNGRGYGESFFEDKMVFVLDELKNKPFYKEGKEGAQIIEFPEETKLPSLMILKKDGATLYSTRDLATDKFRIGRYGKDITIINEVGAEQTLYFQQLYKLEEMLGWFIPGQRIHIKHGHYRFKESKMSTRKGNVVWLEEVLYEAKKRAIRLTAVSGKMRAGFGDLDEVIKRDIAFSQGSRNEDTNKIAIGALKWNDLKRDTKLDIIFDWDEILNMQGNSGPYMQYAYARTQSVLKKVQRAKLKEQKLAKGLELQSEEREVLLLLSRFPEIVEEAALRYAPNVLCTYLFDLAQAFNLFYQKFPILKSEGKTRDFRLELTLQTGGVLKKGLSLLGIQTPEQM